MHLRSSPVERLDGRVRVPGDKSVSHRALMLGAMAVGTTRIRGLLASEDVRATWTALERLGVVVRAAGDDLVEVEGVGVGGFDEPDRVLDFGNAGTATRLVMGLLAGHPFTTFVTGDDSLRSRPMGRVIEPLTRMGASFVTRTGGRLPLALRGTLDLVPIRHEQAVASAQVKSAVLLAGLHAAGRTTVVEPERTRDHSERMLRHFGAEVTVAGAGDGWTIELTGQPELRAAEVVVPADPSSAAFPLVAALALPGSSVRLDSVGINPLRAGLLTTLAEMTGGLQVEPAGDAGGEPIADLIVRGDDLSAVEVPAGRAPSMIDEYPILAVAAACARGVSRFRGLAELRVKESDRLGAVAEGLRACGVECAVEGDDLVVVGRGGRPEGGAVIDARHDHRIAMSFLVMGTLAMRPVTVAAAETIQTSFPGFEALMAKLGARIERVPE